MNGKTKYVLHIVVVTLLVIWGRVGWVLLYPYEPIVIHCIKILDDDGVVKAGTVVNYEVTYTKRMDLPAVVYREFVNSYIINTPSFLSSVPKTQGKVRNALYLPEYADSGVYRLRITYDYTVSTFPTRVIRITALSNSFLVGK